MNGSRSLSSAACLGRHKIQTVVEIVVVPASLTCFVPSPVVLVVPVTSLTLVPRSLPGACSQVPFGMSIAHSFAVSVVPVSAPFAFWPVLLALLLADVPSPSAVSSWNLVTP